MKKWIIVFTFINFFVFNSLLFSTVDSYVLKNDVLYYSSDIKKRIIIRLLERRAYVYTVFKKYNLALECIDKAENFAPERHKFYDYIRKEIRFKQRFENEKIIIIRH